MKARQLTLGDLMSITGYSRHQLRGLLDKLALFSHREATARVANDYTKHEALVVTVCCRLEQRYALSRSIVADLAAQLGEALQGPRPVGQGARLVIGFDPLAVSYVEEVTDQLQDGLVVALGPIFEQVDGYLLAEEATLSSPQRELAFGPGVLRRSAQTPTVAAAGEAATRAQLKEPRK